MKHFVLAPHSLRGRLTLWHCVILGLGLVAFTVAGYGLVARSLIGEIDRSLVERAQPIHGMLLGETRPAVEPRIIVPPPTSFASAGIFVQVTTPEGNVLNVAADPGIVGLPLARLPIPAMLHTAVSVDQPQFRTVRLGGEQVRLYSLPLMVDGQTVAIVHVGRDLEAVERSLSRLRIFAGGGLLMLLACSGVGVWLTTGRALRPLDRLMVTAETVGSSRDLAHRFVAVHAYDEVGRLGATFNQMLERLEAADGELRAANSRLEQTLEAQRRLVADASHELRTPLTTIRGNASLLRQFPEVTPEDRDAALDQIGQEAERMSRLVHDLLTLARADAGQPLRRQPVALGPLVEDVVAQVRMLADGHPLTVYICQSAEIMGDPDALRQLALILLDNAVKYSPNRGSIHVRLEVDETEVRLVVADSGIGIAPDDLPHIFERFYRADRGRKAGGAGLGLSIGLEIAEQHHGLIEVTSVLGTGSTFTVRLPR